MIGFNKLSAAVAAAAFFCASVVKAEKEVFAHIVLGVALSYSYDDCLADVQAAHTVGIDGFALNVASVANEVSAAQTVIGYYYQAAESVGDFKLFISFDYAASDGQYFPSDSVISYINAHKDSAAQFKVGDKPFASTFEGPDHVGDWDGIKSATNAYFVPDYSSKGPAVAAGYSQVDGLLSWDAWPIGTADTPMSDPDYVSALQQAGKSFMMPVSPWFYTNIGKNWVWRGDDLWHERWDQVQQYNPDYVEILTWNDWGESHYIAKNPSDPNVYPGSASYNEPVTHEAWQNDLQYYIGRYKNGGTPAEGSYTPHITFWYRLNPGSVCPNSPCNAPYQDQYGHPAASECDLDEIFFTVFTGQTATVNISIGGAAQPAQAASGSGIYHGSVPFNGQLGDVVISASLSDGSTLGPVTGPAIQNSCVAGWNTWVGGS